MTGNLLSDRIIAFNRSLEFNNPLPPEIRVMNPFKDSVIAKTVSEAFYNTFYKDNKQRTLILGINPGRFGAGITGVPFTDPKRLTSVCGIPFNGEITHEPSSVFVYDVIEAFGGAHAFYDMFYINSVCPLGFISSSGKKTGVVNYNYYDNRQLEAAARPFIIDALHKQIQFGMRTDRAYCLGMGKNFNYLLKLNETYRFFKEIIPLEHPRYIMQYKSRQKQDYIARYINVLS